MNGVLSIHNVDGSHVAGQILWPKSKILEVVDYYLPSGFEHPNHHTNKVYMGAKVESMDVSEIKKNHRLHNNECLGDLTFDCGAKNGV